MVYTPWNDHHEKFILRHWLTRSLGTILPTRSTSPAPLTIGPRRRRWSGKMAILRSKYRYQKSTRRYITRYDPGNIAGRPLRRVMVKRQCLSKWPHLAPGHFQPHNYPNRPSTNFPRDSLLLTATGLQISPHLRSVTALRISTTFSTLTRSRPTPSRQQHLIQPPHKWLVKYRANASHSRARFPKHQLRKVSIWLSTTHLVSQPLSGFSASTNVVWLKCKSSLH